MAKEKKQGRDKFMSNIIFFLLMYLGFIFIVYFAQRSIIYQPFGTMKSPSEYDLNKTEEIVIKTHDGLELKAWLTPPAEQNKTIVFFHGNAGNAGGRHFKTKIFTDAGYGFLTFEYRGYGGNPGKPSETNLKKDAESAIEFLISKGYDEKDLVIYGESIGTGIATYIASKYNNAALMLESPFTSLLNVAKEVYWFFPVKLMLKEKHDTASIIKDINSPLLIVHGEKDSVVEPKFGKELLQIANEPKKGVFIPEAGHNNLHHYGSLQMMIKWLAEIESQPNQPSLSGKTPAKKQTSLSYKIKANSHSSYKRFVRREAYMSGKPLNNIF